MAVGTGLPEEGTPLEVRHPSAYTGQMGEVNRIGTTIPLVPNVHQTPVARGGERKRSAPVLQAGSDNDAIYASG